MATTKKKITIKNCKRLQCLMKKTRELSILCDVDAFFLCFENNSTGGGASSAGAAPPSCCFRWPEDQQTFLSLIKKYKNSLSQPIKKKKKMKESERSETSQECKMGSSHGFDGKSLEDLSTGELQTILCRVDDMLTATEERIRLLTNPNCQENFKETKVLQPSLARSYMAAEALSGQNSENSQKEESEKMVAMNMNSWDFLESQSLYTNGGELEMAGGLLDGDFPGFSEANCYYYSDTVKEALSDQYSEKEKEKPETKVGMNIGSWEFCENRALYTNGGGLDMADGLLDGDFPGFPELEVLNHYYQSEMASEDFLDLSEMDWKQYFET